MKRIITTIIIAVFSSLVWNSSCTQQKPGYDCDKHPNPLTGIEAGLNLDELMYNWLTS